MSCVIVTRVTELLLCIASRFVSWWWHFESYANGVIRSCNFVHFVFPLFVNGTCCGEWIYADVSILCDAIVVCMLVFIDSSLHWRIVLEGNHRIAEIRNARSAEGLHMYLLHLFVTMEKYFKCLVSTVLNKYVCYISHATVTWHCNEKRPQLFATRYICKNSKWPVESNQFVIVVSKSKKIKHDRESTSKTSLSFRWIWICFFSRNNCSFWHRRQSVAQSN